MANENQQTETRKGKLNIYTCDVCFEHIVSVDLDEGVSPFMINCQVTDGCKGYMESSIYHVYDQRMRPDIVWYRPTEKEQAKMSQAMRDHITHGGLDMRPMTKEDPWPLEQATDEG